ncbi:hypothetical protein ACUHMQ_19650, partial [Chitinimonas sp. PSY-7]|uniref:hypothetical protein n=1 Tax=Chitinimonas sp. PSY-7 TaxID=3459088 RepID=UPI0040403E2E
VFQQRADGFELFATDIAGVRGSHWASIAGLELDEKTLNRFLELCSLPMSAAQAVNTAFHLSLQVFVRVSPHYLGSAHETGRVEM